MKLNFLNFFIFLAFSSFAQSQTSILIGAKKPETKELSDNIKIPGTVLANESIQITSVVSEKIYKIHFKEGSFVEKDELLVELYNNEEKAVLDQVYAEYEEAEINYNRALKLSEKGNISKSILDHRLMQKKKLNARINEIKAKLDDLKIKAPFDGYTGIKNFSVGSFIMPGDVIAELHDINTLKIQAFIPEIFSNRLEINDFFFLEADTNIPKNIKGKITVIDPIINKSTRSFKILGQITNTKSKIKPGMMVNLTIPLGKRSSLIVRENSIINQDDISSVYIVNNNSKIIKKKVEIGLKFDGMIEILSGLNPNDIVVYEGINKIKEGSSVKVK